MYYLLIRKIWQQLCIGNWPRLYYTFTWAPLLVYKLYKMQATSENNSNGCCCEPLLAEFKCEKFNLQHVPLEDFCKSQWQRGTKSLYWLLYRWLFAICFSTGVIGSIVEQFYNGKWFIYLTDLGFLLCMYTSVFGAVLTTIYYHNPKNIAAHSRVVKFYWVSHSSTLTASLLISFVYWIFIHPNDGKSPTELYNLWTHAFNSILMLLDHLLVAFPTRLLHVIYPLGIGFFYVIFTFIYYEAGGLDVNGNHYIYDILDWSKPWQALLCAIGCLVMLCIFSVILFVIYQLRSYFGRKRINHIYTCNA